MNKYDFRFAVSSLIYTYRLRGDWSAGGYIEQSQLARALGVRDATVSSWVNKNSCISAFMFVRLLQVFAKFRKCQEAEVFSDFLEILGRRNNGTP